MRRMWSKREVCKLPLRLMRLGYLLLFTKSPCPVKVMFKIFAVWKAWVITGYNIQWKENHRRGTHGRETYHIRLGLRDPDEAGDDTDEGGGGCGGGILQLFLIPFFQLFPLKQRVWSPEASCYLRSKNTDSELLMFWEGRRKWATARDHVSCEKWYC